jgi:hypothetical protein
MKICYAGLVVAFLLVGCDQGHSLSQSKTDLTSKQAQADSAAHAADVADAFVSAFGQAAPVTVTRPADEANGQPAQDLEYNPEALMLLSPGVWVLVSDGTIKDGAHVQFGSLAVHYLTKENGKFKVVGQWLNVGGGAAFGQVASWTVRHDLEQNPVIWTTSDDGGQGCEWTSHDWISLLPNKVQLSASNLLTSVGYTADPSQPGDKSWKTIGVLHPHPEQRAFDIVYTGKSNMTSHYQYVLDGYTDVNTADNSVGC